MVLRAKQSNGSNSFDVIDALKLTTDAKPLNRNCFGEMSQSGKKISRKKIAYAIFPFLFDLKPNKKQKKLKFLCTKLNVLSSLNCL